MTENDAEEAIVNENVRVVEPATKRKRTKRIEPTPSQPVREEAAKPSTAEKVSVECTYCMRWMQEGTLDDGTQAHKCPQCNKTVVVIAI